MEIEQTQRAKGLHTQWTCNTKLDEDQHCQGKNGPFAATFTAWNLTILNMMIFMDFIFLVGKAEIADGISTARGWTSTHRNKHGFVGTHCDTATKASNKRERETGPGLRKKHHVMLFGARRSNIQGNHCSGT
jgi:hypothetical protein